jgi:alginate O-acetyltransferase complex protein AlgI
LLFNSYEFVLAFLPLTFLIYFYLNSRKLTTASKGFLVLASLFFYSWWNIVYLPLIVGSILFNYFIGKSLGKNRTRFILTVGIIGNVLLLGYFKYSDFFIKNYNFVLNTDVNLLHLALPLAISYFTF